MIEFHVNPIITVITIHSDLCLRRSIMLTVIELEWIPRGNRVPKKGWVVSRIFVRHVLHMFTTSISMLSNLYLCAGVVSTSFCAAPWGIEATLRRSNGKMVEICWVYRPKSVEKCGWGGQRPHLLDAPLTCWIIFLSEEGYCCMPLRRSASRLCCDGKPSSNIPWIRMN